MAYQMGRHPIGYEIQKVLSAVDLFARDRPAVPLGVMGCGEGGQIVFYSAALDTRIDAALVSGYFEPREEIWKEPLWRNVWGFLAEFGDSAIASLIAPRSLTIEAAGIPGKVYPLSAPKSLTAVAAGGRIRTPLLSRVRNEFDRAAAWYARLGAAAKLSLTVSGTGDGPPGSQAALESFVRQLDAGKLALPGAASAPTNVAEDAAMRSKRQFHQMVEFNQELVRRSDAACRDFWSKADPSSLASWERTIQPYRDYFWNEIIGRYPPPDQKQPPQTRRIYSKPAWTGYEVLLPVWRDVKVYGILLVPNGLAAGERRGVVVCQHGVEGRPQMVVDPDVDSIYHAYGAKLADRGFIVFAPQGLFTGREQFQLLSRKANPLGKTLYSIMLGQHERILEWLQSLPFVDARRIGFYGLSYGGKSAMRIPPLLTGYAMSIVSADFTEWTWKNTSITFKGSTVFTRTWELNEFNVGNTFNYSGMAALLAPRPFMVERGHRDTVAPDEWVGYEFAKVRRLYSNLKAPVPPQIEFFDGGHEIHGAGTFDYLEKYLKSHK